MKVLGLIPARGGSKGVYKKNIRYVDGIPLIAYSIEVAKKSDCISKVVVSTDSNEIIEVSRNYGADIIRRNSEFAQDASTVEPVINEALEKLQENYDLLILLQPTSPIRETEDLEKVIKMFEEDSSLHTVISVVELEDTHPARMYNLGSNNKMIPLNPTDERKRRQELTPVYLRNGAIYATRVKTFLETGKLINEPKKAYVMPESKWANVDTERDLLITELLIKEWKKGRL